MNEEGAVPDTTLRTVYLLKPALCLDCRFASIATVKMEDGDTRRMLRCARLDCDNWGKVDPELVPAKIERRDD